MMTMALPSPLRDAVRSHYLFEGFDEAVFDALSTRCDVRELDKGEILFHKGDVADYFYFVDAGHIELGLISAAGEKKTVEVVGSGGTFAEAVMFMSGKRYPVTAKAIEDSVVCSVPCATYLEILEADNSACLRLLGDVCRRLHARVQEIERLTVQNARSRLAGYLLDHIDEKNGSGATVKLDLPKQVIASRLSIKPETLSRLLRQLADEDILVIDDRLIYINDLRRLRPYD